MSTRRTFLRLLGLVAVAPKALAELLPYLNRQPKWPELLSPGLYSHWQQLPEDFDTQSTKFVHQSYSIGFRVTREMLQRLPEDHWIKKIPIRRANDTRSHTHRRACSRRAN